MAAAIGIVALLPSSGAGKTQDVDDTLTLTPQGQTLSLGSQYTVVATAAETGGDVDPLGHTITITVTGGPDAGKQTSGPVGPTGGSVSLSYTNAATPGTDQISASVFDNDTPGDTTTATASVSWVDATPPTVHVPADIAAEATGPSGAVVNFTVSATDNVDGTDPVSCSPSSGSTFPLATTTVNCSATDNAGNTGTASFHVTVQDTTPPTLNLPGNITVNATSPSGAPVTFNASATDLVDGTDAVTCSPASGSTFPLGTTSVSCSATDAHGNTASGSFKVAVVDTAPPVLTVPGNFSVEATGPAGAIVDYSVTATDLVDPNPTVVCNPPSGSQFQIRTTPVTCTATDSSGNSASATFRVRVVDTTPPTLTIPGNITTSTADPAGVVVTFSITATDTVDPNPSVNCKPPSGSLFPVGKTSVSCTARDSSGNSVTKTFKVTVSLVPKGGTPPPPSSPPKGTPPAPPAPAGSVIGQPVAGKTEPLVKLPGSAAYVPLSAVKTLPPGTSVNVSGNAAIDLHDASNKQMIFFGIADSVPSVFTLVGKSNGVVRLTLAGGNFKSCGNRKISSLGSQTKTKKPVRRLWGTGKGKFTTTGKYASATVRGTEWLVADYCTGTLVNVRKGLVSVRDLIQKKTKLVAAGHSYFAPSTKPKKKK